MKTYVLAAGGTGGHVFPAQSLATELQKREQRVILVTDQRGQQYLPQIDCMLKVLFIRHKSSKLLFMLDMIGAFFKQLVFLRKTRPHAVIGFGGYPSLPTVLAAQVLRIPTLIHEQNAIMGKANRVLSVLAKDVACAFKEPKNVKRSITFTGNPVRERFFHIKPYQASFDKFVLFVCGGSQGASIFSKVVPVALQKLPEELQEKLVIYQQCRPELMQETQAAFDSFKGEVTLKPFFDDIDQYYGMADLIIARSGASTVAEICVAGRPSLLIPYASSIDGDQWNNAQYLKRHNAAFVLSEYHFTAHDFSQMLESLIREPLILSAMAQNAKNLSVRNACSNLAEASLRLA